MNSDMQDRLRGVAVGAAIGDALGMPLEFGPASSLDRLVRDMQSDRLPAGAFTDDTEMALALAESLLAHRPLDPADLAGRFAAWYRAGPADIGRQTRLVLRRIARGEPWEGAVAAVQAENPWSAGNGSVMRCWPVALAHWDNPDRLLADSRLQSQVTHPHEECVAGCAFVNAAIYHLVRGVAPQEAVAQACDNADLPAALRAVIQAAPTKGRRDLPNTGWVRHTLESAVWGLLTTASFAEAVVQVVNLGDDADTAGAVVGALAGAAYGLEAIPAAWRAALHGEWPLRSGERWDAARLVGLADRLAEAAPLAALDAPCPAPTFAEPLLLRIIQGNSVLNTARGMMDTGPKYRFDPVDHNFMRIRGRLTPGERLLAMLAAREWVVSAKRARLCRRYPDLSPQEINLKVLEEIERAERRQTRTLFLDIVHALKRRRTKRVAKTLRTAWPPDDHG